jgi:hypothetical protein
MIRVLMILFSLILLAGCADGDDGGQSSGSTDGGTLMIACANLASTDGSCQPATAGLVQLGGVTTGPDVLRGATIYMPMVFENPTGSDQGLYFAVGIDTHCNVADPHAWQWVAGAGGPGGSDQVPANGSLSRTPQGYCFLGELGPRVFQVVLLDGAITGIEVAGSYSFTPPTDPAIAPHIIDSWTIEFELIDTP